MATNASETSGPAQDPEDTIREGILEASKAAPTQAQEPQQTPPQDPLADEKVQAAIEAERRKWQSQKDREIHQVRMEVQQQLDRQRREAEERAKLEGMDDEDYGRYVREQAQKQRDLDETTRSSVTQAMLAVQAQSLEAIPDKDVREAIEKKINEGTYKSWGELQKDLLEAYTEKKVAKARVELEKSIREAVQKELAAQLADTPVPTLGSGLPTKSARNLSTDELLEQGWREAIAAKRKG
jgi:uncharacterized membrane protein